MGRLWNAHVAAFCCAAAGTPAAAGERAAPAAPPPRWLVFSGSDVSVRSATGWAGGDLADQGLDADGLRLRGVAGYGHYQSGHPTRPGADITVQKQFATVSAGRTWVTSHGQLSLFAGGEVDARRPDDDAATRRDRGLHYGPAVNAELWAMPAPDLQVTAAAGFGMARSAWTLSASLCHRIGWLCLGPEAGALGDPAGSEVRFGVALAGLSIGAIEMRLAAGIARKDDGEGGRYGFLTVWQRF